GPGPRHVPLDLRTGRLQQPVVLDTRGARGHTGHAAEAGVDVFGEGTFQFDLTALGEIHEVDAPARGVHFLAPQLIRGAGRQAESTVDAFVEQLARRRVRSVETRFRHECSSWVVRSVVAVSWAETAAGAPVVDAVVV